MAASMPAVMTSCHTEEGLDPPTVAIIVRIQKRQARMRACLGESGGTACAVTALPSVSAELHWVRVATHAHRGSVLLGQPRAALSQFVDIAEERE